MRIHLYATEYLAPLPDATFHTLLTLLPPVLRQKVLKFRNWEDQHASLLGKILLRLALQYAGYVPHLDHLHYTETQKPFLPEGPAFNLSHSGNRVVCLIGGQEPLGVDIESITPLPFEDFQPQFTEKEWSVIHNDPIPLNAFYRFWTAKESILKADGRGLGIPLQSLDLSETMTLTVDGTLWSVHELPLFDNYACHYAIRQTGDLPPTIELHEITPARWLDLATRL